MGLFWFMPTEKDGNIDNCEKEYEAKDDWQLYLWKEMKILLE